MATGLQIAPIDALDDFSTKTRSAPPRRSELPVGATANAAATTCPASCAPESLFVMDDDGLLPISSDPALFPNQNSDPLAAAFITSPTNSNTSLSLSNVPRIPFELYRPIFSFVTNPRDLRNLAVASRITQPDAERLLHASVSAKGVRDVASRCRFLARNPRVAALVKTIIFRDREGESRTWGTSVLLPSFYTLIASKSPGLGWHTTLLTPSLQLLSEILSNYPISTRLFSPPSLYPSAYRFASKHLCTTPL